MGVVCPFLVLVLWSFPFQLDGGPLWLDLDPLDPFRSPPVSSLGGGCSLSYYFVWWCTYIYTVHLLPPAVKIPWCLNSPKTARYRTVKRKEADVCTLTYFVIPKCTSIHPYHLSSAYLRPCLAWLSRPISPIHHPSHFFLLSHPISPAPDPINWAKWGNFIAGGAGENGRGCVYARNMYCDSNMWVWVWVLVGGTVGVSCPVL